MGKKELLSKVLTQFGLLRVARSLSPGGITVLTYHRIRPDNCSSATQFDDDVFGPTQSCFEKQMKWLRHNMMVLAEAEVLELVWKGKATKHSFALVTFDDGYRDNYELAYPVLKALSIPAIFFVCPRLLDERRLGWWDVIAYLLKLSAKRQIVIRGQTLDNTVASIRTLHGWMKSLPTYQTKDLLRELSEVSEVAFPSSEAQSEQLMSWEQVVEVARNGVSIGSHTNTHRVLTTLDEDEQRRELTESKALLEQRLGHEVRTIAYPAGRHRNFTASTMRIARECGYYGAFSFRTGGNRFGSVEAFDIHRIAATDSFNPLFMWGVMRPEVFA